MLFQLFFNTNVIKPTYSIVQKEVLTIAYNLSIEFRLIYSNIQL